MNQTKYGWLGEPFESDYVSMWGIIDHTKIVDMRGKTYGRALAEAQEAGLNFIRFDENPTYESELYKVRGNSLKCVEMVMRHHFTNVAKNRSKYREFREARILQIFREIRSRSKNRKGIEFNLDWDDFRTRIMKGYCEVSGLPFDLDVVGTPWAPSVDRIDSSKGYTNDNVQYVCRMLNHMKGAATMDDVMLLANALVARANTQTPGNAAANG